MNKLDTWAVVLTADEPEILILANVAWHLATGASQVFVYLDQPDDSAAEPLAKMPGVTVTQCNAAHWAHLNGGDGRPKLQMRRQTLNANHALAQAQTDWLISLDADEFLCQDRPLAKELTYVAELGVELHFPVWERAYVRRQQITGLFDGVLRGSTKGRHRYDDIIFGPDRGCYINGLLGHSAGKCAVPTGQDFVLGLHWSFRGQARRDKRSNRYTSTTSRLFHFDGLTPLHWLIKIVRYAGHDIDDLLRLVSGHRIEQVNQFLSTNMSHRAGKRLHRALQILRPAHLDRLEGFGLLDRAGFDPLPKIRQVLPEIKATTTAAFDAELIKRYPAAIEAIYDFDPQNT
ncbi:hypothetical protein NBRC116601_28430 [Cognatishimia sp. WU-CL00825]|uniref:glycosyltransferase family 2 protein n=1 Tax=Cognatishimia sp. WU-CL00825 TaxID=3127658 RepID=UPI00310464B8